MAIKYAAERVHQRTFFNQAMIHEFFRPHLMILFHWPNEKKNREEHTFDFYKNVRSLNYLGSSWKKCEICPIFLVSACNQGWVVCIEWNLIENGLNSRKYLSLFSVGRKKKEVFWSKSKYARKKSRNPSSTLSFVRNFDFV